ncbi:MAG: YggT family protein [Propionibacterium sp.]|nr:MAG: YggT family protein [Propionibacterium sp.]
MAVIGTTIALILQIYLFLLFGRMIISWIPIINPGFSPSGVVLLVVELICTLTDPPINLVRKIIPNGPSFGGVRLDLSFLVVVILLVILQRVNAAIFF